MKHYPFALQLYSVRDYCERDPESTLHRVKGAGYDYVELAGFVSRCDLFKTMLDRAELTPVSMHAGFELVVGDTETIVQRQSATLRMVVPGWERKFVLHGSMGHGSGKHECCRRNAGGIRDYPVLSQSCP